MSARQETYELLHRLSTRGINLDFDAANTLRRAQLTLRRWYELECGNGNDYGSWAIEREDNGDGLPFMVHHHYMHGKGKDWVSRARIPDREAGALRRVAAICKANNLHFYRQGDPRGCALYVDKAPIPDDNYSRAVACC